MYKDETKQVIIEIELAAKRIKTEIDGRKEIKSNTEKRIVDRHISISMDNLCELISCFRREYEKTSRKHLVAKEEMDTPQ
jgi:hypothetical protein